MAMADAALGAGAALELDRAALIELVSASSGRSYGFEVRARLPDVVKFGHGARLLAKDVNLLKAILGSDPCTDTLRRAADPFLEKIARAQVPGA
jgi:hypothetical protein